MSDNGGSPNDSPDKTESNQSSLSRNAERNLKVRSTAPRLTISDLPGFSSHFSFVGPLLSKFDVKKRQSDEESGNAGIENPDRRLQETSSIQTARNKATVPAKVAIEQPTSWDETPSSPDSETKSARRSKHNSANLPGRILGAFETPVATLDRMPSPTSPTSSHRSSIFAQPVKPLAFINTVAYPGYEANQNYYQYMPGSEAITAINYVHGTIEPDAIYHVDNSVYHGNPTGMPVNSETTLNIEQQPSRKKVHVSNTGIFR